MFTEAQRRFGPGGIPRPVLLGVLPLHSTRHAEFLHNEVPGITIPDEVRAAIKRRRRARRGGRPEMALRCSPPSTTGSQGPTSCHIRPLRAGRGARPSPPSPSCRREGARLIRDRSARSARSAALGRPLRRLDRRRGRAAAAGRGRRPPVRRSRSPSTARRSTTTPASCPPTTIAKAEATIDAIEERTGAEVVVYTQSSTTASRTEETEARAIAPDRPVGRRPARVRRRPGDLVRHRPVARARPGPALRRARLRGDVPVQRRAPGDLRQRHAAVPARRRRRRGARHRARADRRRGDARARGATSRPARQINAVLGLVGAPIAFLVLAGWAFLSWLRFGKDPVYLDDPSILMPAPPPDLTAASGAVVLDGGTSRRALTTAMLDLASRGEISFREDKGLLGLSNKVGIRHRTAAARRRSRRRGGRSTRAARSGRPRSTRSSELRELGATGGAGLHRGRRPARSSARRSPTFDSKLETHVVAEGLVGRQAQQGRRPLDRARACWPSWRAGSRLFAGFNVPISGLVLIGGATIAGGHRDRPVRPGHAGRSRCPARWSGRCSPPTGGRCRRPWSRLVRCSRSSTKPASTGSRRPTRPSCGARRSGCSARSRSVLRAQPRGRAPAAVDGLGDLLPGLVRHSATGRRWRGAWRRGVAAASSRARPCRTLAG